MGVGACYLVYDAVEGELNIHYSEIPIIGAVGVWTSPDIALFKEAQGLSQSELIGNCASNVMTQDRQQYYSGWCQFVKAAKSMDATVVVLDGLGVPIEFYLYRNGTTARMENCTFETETVDAVACVPKNCDFSSVWGLRGKKWSKAAKKLGAVAVFAALSSKDGEGGSQELLGKVDPNLNHNSNDTISERPAPHQVAKGDHQEVVFPGTSPSIHVTDTPIPESEPLVENKDIKAHKQHGMQSWQHHQQKQQALQPTIITDTVLSSVSAPEPQNAVPIKQEDRGQDQTPPVSSPRSTSLKVETEQLPSSNQISSEEVRAASPPPIGGACYLVYEPDSSGRLVEHYSYTHVAGAIGRWIPGPTKTIAGFKFKRNLGRNVLIGNCSAGVQGRRNYCSGWCQFVRSALGLDGAVTIWDPTVGAKGMMVDVYLYLNDPRPTHQTVRLQQGTAQTTDNLLAVACIPKNTPFFEGMAVDILKWLADGGTHGYSSKL